LLPNLLDQFTQCWLVLWSQKSHSTEETREALPGGHNNRPALREERSVDPLDMNAPIRDRVDRVGDRRQPLRRGVGIGEAVRIDQFSGLTFIDL